MTLRDDSGKKYIYLYNGKTMTRSNLCGVDGLNWGFFYSCFTPVSDRFKQTIETTWRSNKDKKCWAGCNQMKIMIPWNYNHLHTVIQYNLYVDSRIYYVFTYLCHEYKYFGSIKIPMRTSFRFAKYDTVIYRCTTSEELVVYMYKWENIWINLWIFFWILFIHISVYRVTLKCFLKIQNELSQIWKIWKE